VQRDNINQIVGFDNIILGSILAGTKFVEIESKQFGFGDSLWFTRRGFSNVSL
jgi:hypothetical protein